MSIYTAVNAAVLLQEAVGYEERRRAHVRRWRLDRERRATMPASPSLVRSERPRKSPVSLTALDRRCIARSYAALAATYGDALTRSHCVIIRRQIAIDYGVSYTTVVRALAGEWGK